MLHGGIRYLENLDFELVKEALFEKNLWLKLTPHLVKEKRFYLPVYKDSLRPLWQMSIGVFLYDLLSFFKNSAHGKKNANELLEDIPSLKKKNLCGAAYYYDAVVDDAKLALECLYDALENPKVDAVNYVGLTDVKPIENGYEIELTDQITLEKKIVTCEQLVFATGPFTDTLLKQFSYLKWQDKMIASKGSHLWIKKDKISSVHPVVLTPKDGRVIFVIPNDDAILVGTTEKDEPASFNQIPSSTEIEYLLRNLNDYFDGEIDHSDIIGTFAGTRPLVKDPDHPHDLSKTAREHQIYRPHENTFVIVGGKYTTFRVMASHMTAQILRKRGVAYNSHFSKKPLKVQSLATKETIIDANLIKGIIKNEHVRRQEDILRRRLCGAAQSEETIELVKSIFTE
jgi:glycerol-3-phosphate dehydrogenase